MKVAYWLSTILLVVLFLFTGSVELGHFGFIAQNFHRLGYPDYIMTILGVAKMLAIVALLYPGFPTLKEWAYAGGTFLLIGACWSHIASHQPPTPAVVGLVFLFSSYFFWHRLRRVSEAKRVS